MLKKSNPLKLNKTQGYQLIRLKTIMKLQGDVGKMSESIIEKHQQFSLYTLIVLIILGFFSLAGLYLTAKKQLFAKTASIIILVLSVISFGLGAKTGALVAK